MNPSHELPTVRRTNAARRAGTGAALTGVALLALLLVAGSYAGAATPTVKTIKSPFKGSAYVNASTSTSVCGATAAATAPKATLASGAFQGAVSSSSGSGCNPAPVLSSASYYVDEHLAVALGKGLGGGLHQVVATFTVSWKLNATASPAGRSGSSYAYTEVELIPYLLDEKNGSVVYGTNAYGALLYYYSFNGTYGSHGASTWVFYFNGTTLTATHTYALVADLYLYTDASSSGGASSAKATASLGKSELKSVTIA
jgi:hypothetical protein